MTAVKIDRSFVERLQSDDDSTSVVQAIVDIAHATGLRVIAEGVGDHRLQRLVARSGSLVPGKNRFIGKRRNPSLP